MLSAQSSHSEFLGSDTGKTHCFPNLWYIGFFGSIEGSLVSLQLDVGLGKLLIVADSLKQNLGSQVEFIVEAAIPAFLDISLVWLSYEGFQIGQKSLATSSISVNQLGVNSLVFDRLASHQEIACKFSVLLLLLCQNYNTFKHAWIRGFDECINSCLQVLQV